MKLKYILMTGLALSALTSCNDYLDVDAPSKYTNEYVYGSETEINRALNGVYAQLLNGNTYGNAYLTTFCMNSDVDFSANATEAATSTGYRRFDCTSDGSDIKKTWDAAYQGVEYANNFIYNLQNSSLYNLKNSDLTQMMGEAKVIRAIFYNDLVDLWGDVPFTFEPTSQKKDYVTPVADREEIRKQLIADLEAIAPYMKYSSDLSNTVERVSKEACWTMIARLALSAGGYSLHPDKQNVANHGLMTRPADYQSYYKKAQQYCDSVIASGTHALSKSYEDVFVDECNFIVNGGDDPIFEIPFTKITSGSIGYQQGPSSALYEGYTSGKNVWGETKGGARLEAFYRYSFDGNDLRRDYLNGLWYYLYDGTPTIRADYTTHNNKWSKLWATAGTFASNSTDNTGINYPYLRYTDVLLMKSEVDNELNNGPTDAAKACLVKVRNRAFPDSVKAKKVTAYVDSVSASKESFLNAVLNERKWEFAGENMRWKDLVRNNKYAEVLYYTFLRYYSVGQNAGGQSDYIDAVETYDRQPEGRYSMDLPFNMYYHVVANPGNKAKYPNLTMNVLEISNPYHNQKVRPTWTDMQTGNFYAWWNESLGCPTAQCLYSLYGFMRGTETGTINMVNNDGTTSPITFPLTDASKLPVVRYILPFPNAAIQRSAGAYKNYYGYTN